MDTNDRARFANMSDALYGNVQAEIANWKLQNAHAEMSMNNCGTRCSKWVVEDTKPRHVNGVANEGGQFATCR